MGGASEDVRISYGDGSHPRDLIKSLVHKRKQLKLVLKGNLWDSRTVKKNIMPVWARIRSAA